MQFVGRIQTPEPLIRLTHANAGLETVVGHVLSMWGLQRRNGFSWLHGLISPLLPALISVGSMQFNSET